MKEAVRSRRIGLRLLFTFSALMLFAHAAQAQRKQEFTEGDSSAPCEDNQLSLRHEDENAAMGGLRDMKFIFTNTSSSRCSMKGYPTVELLNRAGRPVRGGRAAKGLSRMGDELKRAPRLVMIEPGKTATFWIDYLARGAGATGKPCPSYRKLRVTAPGMKRVFLQSTSYPIEVCSGLEVSPVLAPSDE